MKYPIIIKEIQSYLPIILFIATLNLYTLRDSNPGPTD